MADDLGTSGSRGAQGVRDEYDDGAPPGRRGWGPPQSARAELRKVSILEPEKEEVGRGERGTETKISAAHSTRGGSSYQHSLSARGIKSSGRARSCSDEDLLSSMDRLERATRLPRFEDEADECRRKRAYSRHDGATGRAEAMAGSAEKRVRGPRFGW